MSALQVGFFRNQNSLNAQAHIHQFVPTNDSDRLEVALYGRTADSKNHFSLGGRNLSS